MKFPRTIAPPFSIDANITRTSVVLAVRGEIDMATAAILQQAIEQILDRTCTGVELDLTDVTFADSALVRLLMRFGAHTGARVVVGACSTTVGRLFEISGFDRWPAGAFAGSMAD